MDKLLHQLASIKPHNYLNSGSCRVRILFMKTAFYPREHRWLGLFWSLFAELQCDLGQAVSSQWCFIGISLGKDEPRLSTYREITSKLFLAMGEHPSMAMLSTQGTELCFCMSRRSWTRGTRRTRLEKSWLCLVGLRTSRGTPPTAL